MPNSSARVRNGTAMRQRGKDRVDQILDAARSLFVTQGYSGFSLRRVADRANISLGNLGYYFSSKADLFESMIARILGEYAERWQQISEDFADAPDIQFEAYLDFLFEDCQKRETQLFFYQFWAVAAHDTFVAKAREQSYIEFRKQLQLYCKALNPALNKSRAQTKATLLMALIEGLHVIFFDNDFSSAELKRLRTEFQTQAASLLKS